jgi:hypothetical protein
MFPTNPRSYREWRAAKLADYPARADELTVQIGLGGRHPFELPAGKHGDLFLP